MAWRPRSTPRTPHQPWPGAAPGIPAHPRPLCSRRATRSTTSHDATRIGERRRPAGALRRAGGEQEIQRSASARPRVPFSSVYGDSDERPALLTWGPGVHIACASLRPTSSNPGVDPLARRATSVRANASDSRRARARTHVRVRHPRPVLTSRARSACTLRASGRLRKTTPRCCVALGSRQTQRRPRAPTQCPAPT